MALVVCSLQGAYAPPHLGHKGLAELVGKKLLELYPESMIKLLFMPTSDISKKPSIYKNPAGVNIAEYVSEEDRTNMLQFYCDELNTNAKLEFSVSSIEYEIQHIKGDTATIHTLEKLRSQYPDATLVLAMGEDNARQLPWWSGINKWPTLIDKLLLVDREGQAPAKNTLYEIQSYKGPVGQGFDKPVWAKLNFTNQLLIPGIKMALEGLAKKTELLSQPPGFSSSDVRETLHLFYKARPASQQFTNLERFCGTEVARYLVTHSICAPPRKNGGTRKNKILIRKCSQKPIYARTNAIRFKTRGQSGNTRRP